MIRNTIILVTLASWILIFALDTNARIPEGTYTGQATLRRQPRGKHKQNLAVIIANGHISVFTAQKIEDEDGFILTTAFNYKKHRINTKGLRVHFHNRKLKIRIRKKYFKLRGTATLISDAHNLTSPLKAFSRHENLEDGGVRCGYGVNIGADNYAIISLFAKGEAGGEPSQSFFGRISSNGTFENIYNNSNLGEESEISTVNVSGDEIEVAGTTVRGSFTNNFSKAPCPFKN